MPHNSNSALNILESITFPHTTRYRQTSCGRPMHTPRASFSSPCVWDSSVCLFFLASPAVPQRGLAVNNFRHALKPPPDHFPRQAACLRKFHIVLDFTHLTCNN